MLERVRNMRRRIFLYNTIAVVLALAALLLISGGVIQRVSRHYVNRLPPEGEIDRLILDEVTGDTYTCGLLTDAEVSSGDPAYEIARVSSQGVNRQ